MKRQWNLGMAALVAGALLSLSCAPSGMEPRGSADKDPPRISEILRTKTWNPDESNVDSLALWRDGKGGALLFITAKQGDRVLVCDGVTGRFLRAIGGSGNAPGRMERPNGIAVIDDWLIVVERDNRRVQVFSIPALQSVAVFGEADLIKPYGVTVFRKGAGYEMYVTDDFDWPLEAPTDKPALRVKHYRLTPSAGALSARLVRSFAPPEGADGMKQVETIMEDHENGVLLLCDEEDRSIKLYSLDGRYLDRRIGKGLILDDPEGLAVYRDSSAPGGGWILLADQGEQVTRLRVWTREGHYIGHVVAEPNLANTDGICLSQGDLGPHFREGALYCIHDDQRVHAYSWADLARALNLAEPAGEPH